jgi:hypothetical protein
MTSLLNKILIDYTDLSNNKFLFTTINPSKMDVMTSTSLVLFR